MITSKKSYPSGQGAESEEGGGRDRAESGGWIDLGRDEKQMVSLQTNCTHGNFFVNFQITGNGFCQ